jgi:hypothetical protein
MTGDQKSKLVDLIMDSFTPPVFDQFLDFRLNKKRYRYAGENDTYPTTIYNVLGGAYNEVWEDELLDALASERSKRTALVNLVASIKLENKLLYADEPVKKLDVSGLEALVGNVPNLFIDVFVAGLMANKRCVCRVQSVKSNGNPMFGTGFLIGPDLVLTNYHVVEHAIKNPDWLTRIVCRFDYEIMANKTLNPGMDVRLAPEPILAYSPYCEFDVTGAADINVNWPEDKLDYALVRLESEVGNKSFGIGAENATVSNDNKRDWIKPGKETMAALEKGGHIIIIQHPNREPVQVGIGFEKLLGCDKKGLRVRYGLTTLGGSSGSPCFNKDFEWVALHNMGDPEWIPQYNQGIPANRIVQDLSRKGILLA